MKKDIELEPIIPTKHITANSDGGSLYVTVFVFEDVTDEVVELYLAALGQLTKEFFVMESAR